MKGILQDFSDTANSDNWQWKNSTVAWKQKRAQQKRHNGDAKQKRAAEEIQRRREAEIEIERLRRQLANR